MTRRFLSSVIFVVAAFVTLPHQASACTCSARPPVLDAFEQSDSVVAVKLASVEKIGEKQGQYDIHYIRSTTMIIQKVYKGSLKPGATLKFAQGGGADCIWTFDEDNIGKEYLFYLAKPTRGMSFGPGINSATISDGTAAAEPLYYGNGCGRSVELRGAWDDLAYLDNRAKLEDKTRVSGTFAAWSEFGFNPAGIKIAFIGKSKTFEAKTDDRGFFEIYDMPPGDYIARIGVPFGSKINDYMVRQTSTGFEPYDPAGDRRAPNQVPVRVVTGRHASLDLIFDIDTAIKGTVLSPEGKPMKDVCVMAVSTELQEGDNRGASTCTDAKGEFVLDEMRPGNYRVLANYHGKMDAAAPFGLIFYPGVTDRTAAGIVAVQPGKYASGLVIQIPTTVELVGFKGTFRYSDDMPVSDEWVKFVPDDQGRFDDMNQKTDAAGRFEFKLPKGATGKIVGSEYIYSGEFKDCPKVDELVRRAGKKFLDASSNVVQVDSLRPQELIEITLSFPRCEKVKE